MPYAESWKKGVTVAEAPLYMLLLARVYSTADVSLLVAFARVHFVC